MAGINTEGEGESSQPRRESPVGPSANGARLRTRTDPFLIVCRCFSVFTSIAAILCIVANVLTAVRSIKNGTDLINSIFDGIFRCYAVVIAILVVVAETEWGFIMKFWKVLEYWAGRGMLQIFVAVMTRAYSDISAERKLLVLLQNIASYMLLACGVVYVISGILCIGLLKRSRQKKEVSAEQAIKDLQSLGIYEAHKVVTLVYNLIWMPVTIVACELERRKEELESLLI